MAEVAPIISDLAVILIIAGIALAIVMFILWIIWVIVHRGRKRGRDAVSGTPAKHAGR